MLRQPIHPRGQLRDLLLHQCERARPQRLQHLAGLIGLAPGEELQGKHVRDLGQDLLDGGQLIGAERREYILKDALAAVKEDYDAIFIDCPPSLEMLTLNGLCAAEAIVVPVQCEYFALEGLSDLMGTLRMVKRKMNPRLELFGVVLTMFDGRTNFSNQVAQEVRRHFPGKVFANVIPRNVRLAEAPSHGIPVMQYDKYSRGAKAYKELAEEFKAKL
jgi:chromosome partitioning protein